MIDIANAPEWLRITIITSLCILLCFLVWFFCSERICEIVRKRKQNGGGTPKRGAL